MQLDSKNYDFDERSGITGWEAAYIYDRSVEFSESGRKEHETWRWLFSDSVPVRAFLPSST